MSLRRVERVADFFDEARQLRLAYDAHFQRPFRQGDAAQIWNYWHVPGLYTYLRTGARRILPESLLRRFVRRLEDWAFETLDARVSVSPPLLSIYVNGCRQGFHNDRLNGDWGYVYSLTRWLERRFEGGETLLLRDEVFAGETTAALTQSDLCLVVPPQWNQLLVFDDDIIHGVEVVQGSMNPLDCRVVLHGHLRRRG